ncbi:MAG: hypothetical protein H6719_27775 [Sandaracinaceae bacterium]|nr:hypothetical protein [Sandaracinaceae bacterium]
MRARLLFALAVALVGCDGTSGVDAGRDAAGAMPTVELGTGTSGFEPIPETGGTLELVGGPQGGFHVFLTARIHDLGVDGMLITYSAIDTATTEPVGTPASFLVDASRLARDGDGWVRAGDFLILHNSSPDPVRGLTLEVRVRCEEAGGGLSAEDTRVVTIVDEVGG